jgi:hypothetical protein
MAWKSSVARVGAALNDRSKKRQVVMAWNAYQSPVAAKAASDDPFVAAVVAKAASGDSFVAAVEIRAWNASLSPAVAKAANDDSFVAAGNSVVPTACLFLAAVVMASNAVTLRRDAATPQEVRRASVDPQ